MLRRLALCGIFVLLSAPVAQSITISSVSIVRNAGDSELQSTFNSEGNSAVSVTSAGGTTADGVGVIVSAGTRYAQYAWADNTVGTTTLSTTADYSVTMEIISGNAGTVYDLQIDTTRQGALTLVDDSTFYSCCYSSAEIGSVTGTLGGVVNGGLALGGLTANQGPDNLVINQTGTGISLVGLTGNTSLALNFTWTAEVFSNNDEGAVRLGLESATSGVAADAYPGPGGRAIGNDGHFVVVRATVTSVTLIPEPGTAVLLGLGLLGLSARKVRR